jgi:hypothetical protein
MIRAQFFILESSFVEAKSDMGCPWTGTPAYEVLPQLSVKSLLSKSLTSASFVMNRLLAICR